MQPRGRVGFKGKLDVVVLRQGKPEAWWQKFVRRLKNAIKSANHKQG